MESPRDYRTVIVEDDTLSAEYLRILCRDLEVEVVGVAHDAEAALEMILKERPSWVLMDLRLGGERDGVDVAHAVRAALPETRVIYVTASSDHLTLERIGTEKPHRIIVKPTVPDQLAEAFGIG